MRQPKPFFRKQTGSWYVQIGKKQVPLGPDEAEAHSRYFEIMATRGKELTGPADWREPTVVQVVNKYLAWCEANCAATTFDRRKFTLVKFAKHIGPRMKARDLKPHHVTGWIIEKYSDPKRHSSNYRHTIITFVKFVFAWAENEGFLESNPVRKLKKPRPRIREGWVAVGDWPKLLAGATDRQLQEFLLVMLDCGARVTELFKLEARHFETAAGRIVFPIIESKGEDKVGHRVIYLPPSSLAVVSRLAAEYPEGRLFRNSRGVPWNKNSLRCRFRRLKTIMGMPKLTPTTLRHSFAHYRLINKQDRAVVSKLMGHKDGRMLETRYGHLEDDVEFMREEANRTRSLSPPCGITFG